MEMKLRLVLASAFSVGAAASAQAAPAAHSPIILNAYVTQVGNLCHRSEKGDALLAAVAQRVDLNGDSVDDWVIDVGKACPPTGPAGEYGSQVTVFKGTPEGDAFPAFQQAAFASRLERVGGKTRLVLTLSGASCGATSPTARCDRAVAWSAQANRFDLAPRTPAPANPAATK